MLLWSAAGAGDSSTPSIDPALARGPADALVTIVEFSDFQCPSCKRAQQALGQVMKEFDGQVRLVHKDYPVPSHKGALPAAEAARCAAAQGVFWEYHDLLYLSVPDFSRDDLVRYAGRLSLDREAFATSISSGASSASSLRLAPDPIQRKDSIDDSDHLRQDPVGHTAGA